MPTTYKAPSDLVDLLTDLGLPTKGGRIKLNRYVSASTANGGAGTAFSLLTGITAKLRGADRASADTPAYGADGQVKVKDGKVVMTKAPVMQGFSYVHWIDVAKGQGDPDDFVKVWNWMYDNLDEIQDIKIQLYNQKIDDKGKKTQTPAGAPVPLSDYFPAAANDTEGAKHLRFATGMTKLIADKAWGWDCVGFVANYLMQVDVFSDYPGLTPSQFIDHGGFKEVTSLAQVGPLCTVAHGDAHVQIIDSIEGTKPGGALVVKLCQSSGNKSVNGPMTHSGVTITMSGDANAPFTLAHDGDCPVMGKVKIGKHPNLKAIYPGADARTKG